MGPPGHAQGRQTVGPVVLVASAGRESPPRFSPLHSRTHKGGAVRWFLRKHAPPLPEKLEGAAPGPREEEQRLGPPSARPPEGRPGSSGGGERQRPGGARPATARPQARPQAQFLHRALLAIGAELEESRGQSWPGLDLGKPRSARHREELRRRYAEHSDAEFEELRRQVASREAAVGALRKQVEQLERMLQAARLAAERRAGRKPELDRSNTESEAMLFSTFGNLNAPLRVFDADRLRSSVLQRGIIHGTMDEVQQQISHQWEAEQAMRASVEEQVRAFQKQTVQRKANEAGLFGRHAEILKLRVESLRTEGRVTRLANELRRVYQQLPQVVQQKLSQSVLGHAQQVQKEFVRINGEHHTEHFKWMSVEELNHHIEISVGGMEEMMRTTAQAEQVLADGEMLAGRTVDRISDVQAALASLVDSWAKLAQDPSGSGSPVKEASFRGQARVRTSHTAHSNDDLHGQDSVAATAEHMQQFLKEAEFSAAMVLETTRLLMAGNGAVAD